MSPDMRGDWLTVTQFAELRGVSRLDVEAYIREGVIEAEPVSTPNGPLWLIWVQDAPEPAPPPTPMEAIEAPRFPVGNGRTGYEQGLRIGAGRLGITVAEYRAHVEAGEGWCTACRRWQPADEFYTDKSRRSGLAAVCKRRYRARKEQSA